ncbi:hypothetical protein TRVA0_010S03004 [Trichomonascus vanleenenianus]|uniref:uncharacterized protein n=1 Tax=Trichomonascus vanleenenianus TaxID=2268995 RepID=UPI003EC9FEC7
MAIPRHARERNIAKAIKSGQLPGAAVPLFTAQSVPNLARLSLQTMNLSSDIREDLYEEEPSISGDDISQNDRQNEDILPSYAEAFGDLLEDSELKDLPFRNDLLATVEHVDGRLVMHPPHDLYHETYDFKLQRSMPSDVKYIGKVLYRRHQQDPPVPYQFDLMANANAMQGNGMGPASFPIGHGHININQRYATGLGNPLDLPSARNLIPLTHFDSAEHRNALAPNAMGHQNPWAQLGATGHWNTSVQFNEMSPSNRATPFNAFGQSNGAAVARSTALRPPGDTGLLNGMDTIGHPNAIARQNGASNDTIVPNELEARNYMDTSSRSSLSSARTRARWSSWSRSRARTSRIRARRQSRARNARLRRRINEQRVNKRTREAMNRLVYGTIIDEINTSQEPPGPESLEFLTRSHRVRNFLRNEVGGYLCLADFGSEIMRPDYAHDADTD